MEFLKAFYQSQKPSRADWRFVLSVGTLLGVIGLLIPWLQTIVIVACGAFFALYLLLFLGKGYLYVTGGPDTRKRIIQGLVEGKETRLRSTDKGMGKRPGDKG